MSFSEFVTDRRWWENYQESFRARDALYRIGEMAIFVYMWKASDFNLAQANRATYVQRCPTCTYGEALVNQVYQQPAFDRCPTCFGTLYAGAHGGVMALYFRPSMWQFGEKDIQWLPRGEIEAQNAQVVTTGDMRLFKRDYVFRGDGNRFGVTQVQSLHLSSGFGVVSHTESALTNTLSINRENESSPAYMITLPHGGNILQLLATDNQRLPPDFSPYEFNDAPYPIGV